jgi:hypothetical protein
MREERKGMPDFSGKADLSTEPGDTESFGESMLAGSDDERALAEYRARQTSGTVSGIPHDEARARLGLRKS